MANDVSTISSALVTVLATGLAASYSGIVIERRAAFREEALPSFTRYAVIVTPAGRPVREQRHSVGAIQYWMDFDLYALVKNWDDTLSAFGDTTPNRGLFQLVFDTKELLRGNTLSGVLDQTYDEAGGDEQRLGSGPVLYGEFATRGLQSEEYEFVLRAKIPYRARTQAFCHPR